MKLATYGSLKEGFYNHKRWLGDAKPIATSRTRGGMYLISKAYPMLVKTGGPQHIHDVEIYDVDDTTFEQIYFMETGAGYYCQVEAFDTDDGLTLAAVFYADESAVPEDAPAIAEYSAVTAPLAVTHQS